MRPVNLKASRLFEKLIALANDNNGYIKIDNAASFMPISVQKIGPNIYAAAHYYEQNGDMMRDPEIRLWRSPFTERLYPIGYRQDPYCDRELATMGADGMPESYNVQAQKEAAVFCGQWAENIKRQQGI